LEWSGQDFQNTGNKCRNWQMGLHCTKNLLQAKETPTE
jgi:hypothetical protein